MVYNTYSFLSKTDNKDIFTDNWVVVIWNDIKTFIIKYDNVNILKSLIY